MVSVFCLSVKLARGYTISRSRDQVCDGLTLIRSPLSGFTLIKSPTEKTESYKSLRVFCRTTSVVRGNVLNQNSQSESRHFLNLLDSPSFQFRILWPPLGGTRYPITNKPTSFVKKISTFNPFHMTRTNGICEYINLIFDIVPCINIKIPADHRNLRHN